jgi:hypothetical protein
MKRPSWYQVRGVCHVNRGGPEWEPVIAARSECQVAHTVHATAFFFLLSSFLYYIYSRIFSFLGTELQKEGLTVGRSDVP